MYQELLYAVEDPIATITFNRPERLNAMTNRMTDELKHAVAAAEADERAVAIVLTGAGRGFCAGADLQGLKSLGEGGSYGEGANLEASPGDASMGPNFQGPYAYLFSVRKPVIAAARFPKPVRSRHGPDCPSRQLEIMIRSGFTSRSVCQPSP